MCSFLDFSVFVLEILIILAQYHGVSGIQCYSCSYTRSNDWKVDYECVTIPANVTRGDPQPKCPAAESSCYVIVVYTEGYVQVNSALRGCGKSDLRCKDKSCCNEFGPYPTCWTLCDTDLCNDIDGETKFAVKSDQEKLAPKNDRNAGVRHWNDFWILLTFTAIVLSNMTDLI
ncbi:hypothetical protein CHS0354_015085 [Potamilus streckersoni]|uniref:Uncharacterized protein n=1 Tax=Potamilus streckersoni TaxID=2493646 RepID=A0AAE0TGD8_9BIVA|nr:hypothetical protein CHS0354_015085 [Potamilus streckersoni]